MGKHSVKLDNTDLQILKLVQEDGRISNLEISNRIGLSPAPTLERMRKLEKTKVIKNYHAEVDENELGIAVQTLMLVSLSRNRRNAVQNFTREIEQINEIVECYHITGSHDYILKIMVKDMPSYEKLAVEKIGNISEISHMETMVILSTIKKSKIVPVEYE